MQISATVGLGGANRARDVAVVQTLLNRYISSGNLVMSGLQPLTVDGRWGPKTKAALGMFQLVFVGLPTNKVEPGSATLRKLAEMSYAGIEKLLEKFLEEAWARARQDAGSKQTQSINLNFAQNAVNYVRSKMKAGAANKLDDLKNSWGRSGLCVLSGRLVGALTRGNVIQELEQLARLAEEGGCGNCGEQAALAFIRLRNLNIKPIEIYYRRHADHSFVVIGRDIATKSSDPSSWGAEPAVCDPWHGRAYSADRIHTLIYGGGRLEPELLIRLSAKQELPSNIG